MVDSQHIRSVDLLCWMGAHGGIRYGKDKIDEAIDYTNKMAHDGRIIEIKDGEGLHTVIFFSICKTIEDFYKKKTWEYREHDPQGHIWYAEKAVSRGWTKDIRNQLKQLMLQRFPKLRIGKWHRWGKKSDRPVTIRRNDG